MKQNPPTRGYSGVGGEGIYPEKVDPLAKRDGRGIRLSATMLALGLTRHYRASILLGL